MGISDDDSSSGSDSGSKNKRMPEEDYPGYKKSSYKRHSAIDTEQTLLASSAILARTNPRNGYKSIYLSVLLLLSLLLLF